QYRNHEVCCRDMINRSCPYYYETVNKPAFFAILSSRGVVRPSGCDASRPSAPQAYSSVRRGCATERNAADAGLTAPQQEGWRRRRVPGKKGSIPDHLPPILQRLSISPGQYLNFIRKSGSGLLTVLGALDKIKECAAHFQKFFLKGQTNAAALFSPGR
ncbi:MAG: hypothetical protein ABR550_12835, partial [Wenzhouxiangellaceae bacterium]